MYNLYEEIILDHATKPRNYKKLDSPYEYTSHNNPFCGDNIELYLKYNIDKSNIEDISFQGKGCALSQASASIMTEVIKTKNIKEAIQLINNFHEFITKNNTTNLIPEKLSVFKNIYQFPQRVKCVTFPWHALNSILKNN